MYVYDRDDFAQPGGRSALRASRKGNRRTLPCPTCCVKNRLTPRDRDLGYQCDSCADRAEGSYSASGAERSSYMGADY